MAWKLGKCLGEYESLIYDIYIGVVTCIVPRRQFLGQTVSFGFASFSGHNDLNLLFNVHMGGRLGVVQRGDLSPGMVHFF